MGRKAILVLVIMAIFAGSNAMAASDIGLKGVNLRVGYVSPEGDIESTIGFGGGVDLGTITPNIGLGVVLFYWSKSYDVGIYSWTFSDFAIKVNGKYYFPMEKVKPYVGAGIGLHMCSSKWENPAYTPYPGYTVPGGSETSSDTKFGFHVLGGVEYPINEKVGLLAELEYSLVSDVNQLIIGAGVTYKLGK
jgi:opacity protein-like surface antigen